MAGWRERGYLLLLWVQRDLRARYAGTAAGWVWLLLSPLLSVGLFYLIFAVVLKVRVPELATDSGYFLYLLAGLLPWLTVGESLSRAVSCLHDHEPVLQKMVFPVEVLPVSMVLTAQLPLLVGSLLLLLLLLAEGLAGWHLLALPVLWLGHVLLLSGCALGLAVLGLAVRDVAQMLPAVLQFLLYSAPILYPRSQIPADWQYLLLFSPFAGLIEAWQGAWLGWPMSFWGIGSLIVWTLLLGGGGLFLFWRARPMLGERW